MRATGWWLVWFRLAEEQEVKITMSSGSSGMRVTVPEPSRSMFLDFCFMVRSRYSISRGITVCVSDCLCEN